MKTSLKILVVDDNSFYREGLKYALGRILDIKSVHEATGGKDYLEKVNELRPDLIFMDIRMPGMDGITATRISMQENSSLKIIALTMFSDKNYLMEMIGAGAKGFLLKDSDFDEIKEAVKNVSIGEKYYSPKIIDILNRGGCRDEY